MFTRQGQTWTERAKLTASDGAAFDQFGFSAAVHGDTVMVGAPFETESAPTPPRGSAYVFGGLHQ